MSIDSNISNNSNIASLAHKISFAVFRVGRLVRNKKLRSELESVAIDLVRDLKEESVGALDRLVALAEAVGEMNETNSCVLRRELNNLFMMISLEKAKPAVQNETVYLGDVFDSGEGRNVESHVVGVMRRENMNTGQRHSAILEFIRQFPDNCRMKDLTAEFADVSERTLRNDIGFLIGTGFVKRLGGKSGPSSYFAVVDEASRGGVDVDAYNSESSAILLPEAGAFRGN